MKFTFIIQGEGRGHFSQAIALKEILLSGSHEVKSVLIGKSSYREVPAYFYKQFKNIPIYTFNSPNFIRTNNNAGIKIWKSIFFNLTLFPKYIRSIKFISQSIKTHKVDCVVNFYEPLSGLVYKYLNPGVPKVSLAHQFLATHQSFRFPQGNYFKKRLLFVLNKITAYGSTKIFALSFTPLKPEKLKNILVSPPLLRNKIIDLQSDDQDFIMGYILNHGIAEHIINWHKGNTHVKCIFFWDKPESKEKLVINKNLVFYRPNDEKFIEYLRKCKGFITTAGFESVCEAFYLNKKMMVVPVKGHYEQLCNAFEAEKHGAVRNEEYNPSILIKEIGKNGNEQNTDIKKWIKQAKSFYLRELTNFLEVLK